MAKLFNAIIVFGPVQEQIKVFKKYTNPNERFDENLMSQLCLPTIQRLPKPAEPIFQTFVVTKENGQVFYGSGLIVFVKNKATSLYESYCYTIIANSPFIHATRSLLNLIWEKKCDDVIIRCIMNIPLPKKRKCLRIMLPPTQRTCRTGDIFLYRGTTDLNSLDYPLREVFQILPLDAFLLAFICILLEYRTLIVSKDNYQLMMIGETLTSIIQPLKWCNVYVPILPPVYGATYLDAPTSYIMGLNTQVTELPADLSHIQCQIYCDEGKVVCSAKTLSLPPFFKQLVTQIKSHFSTYNMNLDNNNSVLGEKGPSYLQDLIFNQAIRITFLKAITQNILKDYKRYIVDVSDTQVFDVVSYLSDQPDSMRPFLGQFLETQLFASFVDDNFTKIKQYRESSQLPLGIFDSDLDEDLEVTMKQALEHAFQTASRFHLMDLRDAQTDDLEIKTAPATPMKLRRKAPTLAAIGGHMSLDPSMSFGGGSLSKPRPTLAAIQTISKPQPPPSKLTQDSNVSESTPTKSLPTSNCETSKPSSGRILELINEVKVKTKKILIKNINSSPSSPQGANFCKERSEMELVSSLCDLIERIWSHRAYASDHDGSSFSPLWNHLLNFARLKYLDTKPARNEFADGSHLNILAPEKSERNELDIRAQSSFLSIFERFKRSKMNLINPSARLLVADLHEIQRLDDVKTDVGRARAFIRLALERKRLSDHLKTLLSDQALLQSLYKPYAFLRCEDERDQFLMYIWTLKDVDLQCYTTSFVSVIETRRLKALR